MKKYLRFLLPVCILMLLFAAGCGKKTTEINPNDYFKATFSGYDGYGSYESLEFDAASLRDDYEKQLGDVSKTKLTNLLLGGVVVRWGNDSKLSNGDVIHIEWDVDEEKLAELEKECKVKFVLNDFELRVNTLLPIEKFDPFEGVTINASGISGSGTVSATMPNDAVLNLAFLDADGNKASRLYNVKNGDKVQLVVNVNNADLEAYCLNRYQKVPTRTTLEYTVSGLDEYVNDISLVSSDLTEKLKTETIEKLKEQASSWIIPDSLCEITYMGDALRVYTGGNSYYSNSQNTYVILFKVDVDSPKSGYFSYYFTGAITNLLKNSAGEYTYDQLTVPNYSGWWGGTYFKRDDLYYGGYESYEAVETGLFTDAENYKDTLNFDKTIIDKATHTAKDFSVIDATVTLEAADVCFKRNDGYNTIVGFTQSGYDKIMAYSAVQQIKLVLPSKDTEDADVDDVHFYSRAVSGTEGFNFNTLIETANCPRIYIVLPETCSRFNGFRDSSINTDYIYKISGVDLNASLKTIGNYAFTSLNGIKNITIPADVAIIPYRCFQSCTSLEKVVFLGKITKFDSDCFQNCSKLVIEELRLEDQMICGDAFSGVTINHLILASDNYKSEDSYARSEWNKCNVVSLEILDSVTIIHQNCFRGLISITEVTIPSSVTEIGEAAFRDCTALEKVTFPEKMPKLCDLAFYNCTALVIDSLTLDADLDLNDACLSGVTINTVTYASDNFVTTTKWGNSKDCLEGCNVKNFVFADTVTKVPTYLFAGMKFTNKIELPSNVTTIEKYAFRSYDDMIKLVCTASVANIDDDIRLNTNVTVYAPKGSAMITYCINKNIRYEETE